jgi:hypothetical protein
VAYVVGDPVGLVDYAGSWTPKELYQAPLIRPAPHLVMKRPPVDGFADLMAVSGFDDRHTLVALATVWDRQLQLLKPDVIIGFYAPVLWLVGPAHAPTFALGNGATLPPVLGATFPRLSAESTPLATDEVMLENANAVLARMGQPALFALSEVIGGCTSVLYGLPAFDPYLQLRRLVSAGLLGDQVNPAVPPAEQRLAAFLDVYCPGIETLVLALAGSNRLPVDIYVSGATRGMRRFLEEQPHINVWTEHLALLERAPTASALVHHGAQDVAQRCLSVGRPQLIVPWTREQEFFEGLVRWMGFTWTKPPTTTIDDLAGTLGALLRDASLTVSAQHHARQLAETGLPDALPTIVEQIEGAGRSNSASAVRVQPLKAYN